MKEELIYCRKDIAIKYGIPTAMLLQHFGYWYKRVVKEDHQFFKGDYWVRMKIEKIQSYIGIYTIPQLHYCIKKMIENDLLKKSEFNVRKNDRTKWYTLTNKSKKLLGIIDSKDSTSKRQQTKKREEKSTINLSDDFLSPSDEILSSIYKEEDIIMKYKYILNKLAKNRYLLSLLSKNYKLPEKTVKKQIICFAMFCQSISEPIHSNDRKLFVHFSRWLKQQNTKDIDYERELEWFMKMFNDISRGDFVITHTIRELFAKQMVNGFTGKQMARAVKNLFSHSSSNSFHLKHHFKFATPEYLLKDGNLHKYMNLKKQQKN